VVEEVMLRMAAPSTADRAEKLCLAAAWPSTAWRTGGSSARGLKRLWIQPAAGDAGGALGVALLAYHRYFGGTRVNGSGRDQMQGALLGPAFTDAEIEAFLQSQGAPYRRLDRDLLLWEVATLLAHEKVVGWYQGRMEFGPRALGSRSILGDPRSPKMQALMNIKVKFREGFRPFAPSVLRERVAEYFELQEDSPYMLLVAPVKRERQIQMSEEEQRLWGIDKLNVPRSDIPAVTHVDYSARIQTVAREDNPLYYDLLRAFETHTGCPVLVNTSFNVRGEPIVCTPADAYRCFMRTHIDYLALGPFLLDKKEQPPWQETGDWRKEFQLD
jgi:carbamoyltransferase